MRTNLIALMLVAAVPALAHAQNTGTTVAVVEVEDEDDPDADEFAQEGNIEIGGTVGASFNEETLTLLASPQVGYYIANRIELSALFTVTYVRTEDDLGMDESVTTGALLAEPSYHHPFADNLLFLGGLAVGSGYNGDNFDLQIIPRFGMNFLVSEWSAVTPSIRMPILVGEAHGDGGDVGTDIGLVFDVTVSTML